METPKRYKSWMLGLALGSLIALLLWPPTRWLAPLQFRLLLPLPSSFSAVQLNRASAGMMIDDLTQIEHAYRAVSTQRPDDLAIQLTDAAWKRPSETDRAPVLRHLHALTDRFPNSPILYANILRLMTLSAVKVDREQEEAALTGTSGLKTSKKTAVNTPEYLAQFDADAAEGERLDPDNAYFPFMRAIGLLAAHQDNEALAAIQRASEKSRWEEYYAAQVEGEWRLQEAAFGHPSALLRVLSSAALLFPQYGELRAVSRLAILKAVEAEQEERAEEGLAIRRAVLQCGSLMRVQSRSLTGSVVGVLINRIAIQRPGGAPLTASDRLQTEQLQDQGPSREKSEQLNEVRLRAFEAYLQRIGHAGESSAIRAEIAAGIQVRRLTAHGIQNSPFDIPLWKLIGLWAADMVVLSSVWWVLALGGAAALLARRRQIRDGRALPSYAQRGIAIGILASVPGVLGMLFGGLRFPFFCLVAMPLGVVLGTLALLVSNCPLAERLRSLGVFAAVVIGIPMAVIMGYAQIETGPVGSLVQMALALLGGESDAGPGPTHADKLIILRLCTLAVTAVPLLMLLAIGAVSRICRIPLSVGLVRGVRGCAVPVASVLLLIYAGLVTATLRQERTVIEGLNQTLRHEGRFIAESIGETWPGAVH